MYLPPLSTTCHNCKSRRRQNHRFSLHPSQKKAEKMQFINIRRESQEGDGHLLQATLAQPAFYIAVSLPVVSAEFFSRNSHTEFELRPLQFQHTEEWNWRSIVMTLAVIAFLSSTKLLAKKKPKLFWVAAVAPLLSMVIATASVYATRIDKHGVQISGYIKKGLDPSSAIKIGLIPGLMAMTEGLAIRRTFAKLHRHCLDGNRMKWWHLPS